MANHEYDITKIDERLGKCSAQELKRILDHGTSSKQIEDDTALAKLASDTLYYRILHGRFPDGVARAFDKKVTTA